MPINLNDLDVIETQALWYAWGQQDAGITLPGDAFAFARKYREHIEDFRAGRAGMGQSVQGALAMWRMTRGGDLA